MIKSKWCFLVLLGCSRVAFADPDINKVYDRCEKIVRNGKADSENNPPLNLGLCKMLMNNLRSNQASAKKIDRAYPGSGKDIVLSNITADIKRSPGGAPLTLLIHYDVDVTSNTYVSILAPFDIKKVTERSAPFEDSNGFYLIDGVITPKAEKLREARPDIVSQFGLEKGRHYHVTAEYSPWFIFGYRAPSGLPCFDPRARLRREPVGQSSVFLSDKTSAFLFKTDLDQYRNQEVTPHVTVSKMLNVLPLKEFYDGNRIAGTPDCVETKGGGMAISGRSNADK